ncbi:MAG: class I SAM-dependent methyltransferase [Pseudomonadota bacterium]
MSLADCPLGTRSAPVPVFRFEAMPVLCNQLWPDRETARAAPVGDLDLAFCPETGLIWNRAFDPALMQYTEGYENALHFSPRFRDFADALARRLIDTYTLSGAEVVEIGCGDGHFLGMLLERGVGRGRGYDPSMSEQDARAASRPGLDIVTTYFGPDTLGDAGDFKAVICRHVLEHIDSPIAFMSEIRRAIGTRDVVVYLEVPNASWMLQEASIWDVIYEHVTYWTPPAMETLLRRSGFKPVSISSGFGDQFLMVEAQPAEPEPDWLPDDLSAVEAGARRLGAVAEDTLTTWRARLDEAKGPVVLWGTGSKGITFINCIGAPGDVITGCIDLNTRKHGSFVPGAGVEVHAPEGLAALDPELVLIANANYRDEIADTVHALGLSPAFETIAG